MQITPKYLRWNMSLIQFAEIPIDAFEVVDRGSVEVRYAPLLVGMHVAHTVGEGELVSSTDILASEEEEGRLQNVAR